MQNPTKPDKTRQPLEMPRMEPGPGRFLLGFAEEVTAAFDFLITEYGFTLVRSEPTFVRYASPSAFTNVYHGRASYQLNVEIGQAARAPDQPERLFDLGDIIDLAGVREQLGYTFLQASTRDRVRGLVPKLALLVREYAGPALRGDPPTFDGLARIRSEKSDNYLRGMKLERIRQAAEVAWRAKDYPQLVALFESIEEDLTKLETKKLQYARKRV